MRNCKLCSSGGAAIFIPNRKFKSREETSGQVAAASSQRKRNLSKAARWKASRLANCTTQGRRPGTVSFEWMSMQDALC